MCNSCAASQMTSSYLREIMEWHYGTEKVRSDTTTGWRVIVQGDDGTEIITMTGELSGEPGDGTQMIQFSCAMELGDDLARRAVEGQAWGFSKPLVQSGYLISVSMLPLGDYVDPKQVALAAQWTSNELTQHAAAAIQSA